MNLSDMDLWRLVDELTILDAAILINGGNPSMLRRTPVWALRSNAPEPISPVGSRRKPSRSQEELAKFRAREKAEADERLLREQVERDLAPIIEALKSSVLSGKLRANIVLILPEETDTEVTVNQTNLTEVDCLNRILDRVGKGLTLYRNAQFPDVSVKRVNDPAGGVNMSIEPDWNATKVVRDELKDWLQGRGLTPLISSQSLKLMNSRTRTTQGIQQSWHVRSLPGMLSPKPRHGRV